MIPVIRWQDVADIVIMSFLAYQLYVWFRHTRAMQVLIGMVFLVGVYFVTKNLGLFMTSWILQELGTVLFILIIVIFQAEIRQALYRFSLLRNFFERQVGGVQLDLQELSRTVFHLARNRIGAIIVLQRQESLDEHLLHGVRIDSISNGQLIESIFMDGSPLHDGAAVIKDGRITQVSCHLPLSTKTELPRHFGTRHRAGIGLSERCDAAVIIVSEERGEVGLALGGEIEVIGSEEGLAERLQGLLAPQSQEKVHVTLRQRLFRNLVPKLVTALVVIVSWMVITTKQGGIFTVTVPIKFHNLPADSVLLKSTPEEVEVQLKVFSSLIPSPKQLDLVADLDLSGTRVGTNNIAIGESNLNLPLGVVVTGMNPSVVKVSIGRKVQKTLRVRPTLEGAPAGRQRLKGVLVEPSAVLVEGPDQVLAGIDSIRTEAIDLTGIRQGMVFETKLVLPSPQLRILNGENVKVRVVTASKR